MTGVAHLPGGHPFAERRHPTAELHAWDLVGHGRAGIEAATLQQIGPVQGGGDHVDHHLFGPGLRIGHLAKGEDLGPAMVFEHDRQHPATLRRHSCSGRSLQVPQSRSGWSCTPLLGHGSDQPVRERGHLSLHSGVRFGCRKLRMAPCRRGLRPLRRPAGPAGRGRRGGRELARTGRRGRGLVDRRHVDGSSPWSWPSGAGWG